METMEKKGYLNRLKKATELDRGHPRHHGVKMQAHHLLSADGFKKSGKVSFFKGLGYDINAIENLAFIPSTLQGACHLAVQLHRGNHDSSDPDAADSDSEHPIGYHRKIAKVIADCAARLDKIDVCKMNASEREKRAQKLLDNAAAKIAIKIDRFRAITDTGCNILLINPRAFSQCKSWVCFHGFHSGGSIKSDRLRRRKRPSKPSSRDAKS